MANDYIITVDLLGGTARTTLDELEERVKQLAQRADSAFSKVNENINASAASQAAAVGQVARSSRSAESTLISLVKVYPVVASAIDEVVQKYGSFNATVGNTAPVGDAQREFLQLISSHQVLGAELQKLIAAEGEFTVAINQSTFAAQARAQRNLELRQLNVQFAQSVREASRAERDSSQVQAQLDRDRRKAENQILRLIRAYPRTAAEIDRLTKKYGSFRVDLNKTTGEMSVQQQATQRLIAANPILAREIAQVSSEWKEMAISIDQATFRGDKLTSGFSPGKLAAIAGGVAAVTNQIVNMGRQIVNTIKGALEEVVNVAIETESIGASLTAVFDGIDEVGLAVMDRIRQESVRLGIEVNQLAQVMRRTLPQVDSIEQAVRIAEITAGLARLDPEQARSGGATIAIQEALAGELQSIRRRFELPTERIADLQKELGTVEGLVVGLEEILSQRGVSFEALADTGEVALARIRAGLSLLKEDAGQPILDVLTEQANAFLKQIGEFDEQGRFVGIREDVRNFAVIVGQTVGDVLENIGDLVLSFQETLKLQELAEFIQRVQRITELMSDLKALIDDLRDVKSVFGFFSEVPVQIGDSENALTEFIGRMGDVEAHLLTFVRLFGIINALIATSKASIATLAATLKGISSGDLTIVEAGQMIQLEGQEAFAEEMRRVMEMVNEHGNAVAEDTAQLNENSEALREQSSELEKTAGAILKYQDALRQVEEAEADRKEAIEEANEATEEARKSYRENVIEAEIDFANRILDIEKDASEKRADLIRKLGFKIADIARKNRQDLADEELHYGRNLEDIARKHADKLEDIERESNEKKLDAEEEFQDELDKLRRKFLFDAEEAIRENDAVALLRLRRRLEFDIEEAKLAKDEKVRDAEEEAQRKADALEVGNQREIRDAEIANQRKLEDLKTALRRKIEEEKIAYQRSLVELQIANQRELAEALTNYARRLEELKRFQARKLADIRKGTMDEERAYQDAVDALAVAEREKIKILRQATDDIQRELRRRNLIIRNSERIPGVPGVPGGGPLVPGTPGVSLPVNPVPPLTPVPSLPPGGGGDGSGPPVFAYRQPGSLGDNLTYSPPAQNIVGASVDNSRRLDANITVTDPTTMSAVQRRALRNEMLALLEETYR